MAENTKDVAEQKEKSQPLEESEGRVQEDYLAGEEQGAEAVGGSYLRIGLPWRYDCSD